MKCDNCNALARCECKECHKWVCRVHSNVVFNEESRSFANLCGACYSNQRRLAWTKERQYARSVRVHAQTD